ncbi:39S ribosomal protein L37, mitochondrial-like [Actinia tenebrosa]|uniref:Large ribosomal subunit protein mL37 n=1 Tax=Actinia tenebrosa TaxID=6105 RepID=A0A6P8HVJ6_ACTTE|nr:39S ribosomal protein L37, mitochondrial-like [Actinia tenebrosa]
MVDKMAAFFPRGKISHQIFSVLRRRLSTVAAAEKPTTTQKGIPFIVPRHTIKKALIVHPKSRAFQPSLKHQWLTKTILNQGLPESCLENSNLFPEEIQKSVDIFQSSLIQQLGFQKELKKHKTNFEEEVKLGIFQDILRICWGFSNKCSRLRESFLDVSPKIHTHWVRGHEFCQLVYHPDLVLWTNEPNVIYKKDIESTIETSLPGPYDSYSQGLFQHPIVHLRNFPGFQPGRNNPFPHSHTIFLSEVSNQTIDQIHAYGIMNMFGVLVSKAISDGNFVGQHLGTPLTTQCVITNGTEVVLMCYQLNTLSLQEDHGIKNLAWSSEKMNFFTSPEKNDSEDRSIKLYGSFDTRKDCPTINEKCIQNLLAFICN